MRSAAELVKPNQPHKDLPKDAGEECLQRLDQLRNSKGNLHTAEIRRNMQRIMQVATSPLAPNAAMVPSFQASYWLIIDLEIAKLACCSNVLPPHALVTCWTVAVSVAT